MSSTNPPTPDHDTNLLLAATPSSVSKKKRIKPSRRGLFAALVIVLLAASVLTLYYFSNRTSYFAGLEERTNTESNVNLSVPSDWIPVEYADGRLEYVPTDSPSSTHDSQGSRNAHTRQGALARVQVTPQGEVASNWPELSEDSKKSVVDAILKDSQEGKFSFGFVNPSIATINGVYGIFGETIETNSHYSTEMRGLAFVSVNPEGVLHKVVAIVPAKDFTANKSAMQKMIESFSYAQKETEN